MQFQETDREKYYYQGIQLFGRFIEFDAILMQNPRQTSAYYPPKECKLKVSMSRARVVQ